MWLTRKSFVPSNFYSSFPKIPNSNKKTCYLGFNLNYLDIPSHIFLSCSTSYEVESHRLLQAPRRHRFLQWSNVHGIRVDDITNNGETKCAHSVAPLYRKPFWGMLHFQEMASHPIVQYYFLFLKNKPTQYVGMVTEGLKTAHSFATSGNYS